MNVKENKKMVYEPPVIKVIRLVLEEVIAASPVQKVNLNDWIDEDMFEATKNQADIVLNF